MPFVNKRCLAPMLYASFMMLWIAGASAQPASGPVTVTEPVSEQFRLLLSDPRVQTALTEIEANEPETLAEQVRLTEIPAHLFMSSAALSTIFSKCLTAACPMRTSIPKAM